ncbi:MAG: hypothetical protein IKE70_00210 [Bacilli bacterium]|nr:hypothetical protein [Bacilli bacterium]
MISISSSSLDQKDCFYSGTYGKVYQISEDKAIKIYKKLILADNGNYYVNPTLARNLSMYQYMIKKGKKIQYSDFLEDVVFVDGQLLGVLIPFYQGKTFEHYMDSSFSFKYQLIKEFVRNAKELTDHFIYPTDFKLNNLMVSDSHTKIIDLDDTCTKYCHIPHPNYRKESMITLNGTIQNFFDVHPLKGYSAFLKKELEVGYFPYCSSYSKLNELLKKLGEEEDYCIVSDISDFDFSDSNLKRFKLLYKTPFFVVGDLYYQKIIQKFREKGFSLYDFITEEDEEHFISNHAVSNLYEFRGKTFIKK